MSKRLRSLELRVPPVAVAIVAAMATWFASLPERPPGVSMRTRVIGAGVLALLGAGVTLAGVASFRHARTTVNPTKPETASALVRSGIYRVTRNPMYLGFSIILLAWAVFLSSAAAAIVAVLFAVYIDRFQIVPEERALSALFGADFASYKAEVRRWL